jgi:hypothetical protein
MEGDLAGRPRHRRSIDLVTIDEDSERSDRHERGRLAGQQDGAADEQRFADDAGFVFGE